MQPLDLLILALATYLLTDALVNRALPWKIMGRLRERVNSDIFRCFYCASIWAGFIVTGLWLIEPCLLIPLAAAGGAVLSWRYTGGNHT